MITINKNDKGINITGHADPTICAAVSSVMFTGINTLFEFDEDCIKVEDNSEDDFVSISIIKDSETVQKVICVMMKMFHDIYDQVPENSISFTSE